MVLVLAWCGCRGADHSGVFGWKAQQIWAGRAPARFEPEQELFELGQAVLAPSLAFMDNGTGAIAQQTILPRPRPYRLPPRLVRKYWSGEGCAARALPPRAW